MRKEFLIILMICVCRFASAQDADFSQYFTSKLLVNPAYAGLEKGLHVSLANRIEWPRITSSFNTYALTISVQELNLAGGLGLVASQSQEGEGKLKTQQYGLIYSYKLIILPRKLELQTGYQADYLIKSVDWGRLEFSDQFHPVDGMVYSSNAERPDQSSRGFVDFSIGAIARYVLEVNNKPSRVLLGYSVKHVTQPDESILRQQKVLPRLHNIQASMMIPVEGVISSQSTYISPAFLLQMQGKFSTTNLSAFVIKQPLVAGLGYRSRNMDVRKIDSFLFHLGLMGISKSGTRYQFTYSFDHTISRLALSTAGSHEIGFLFEFDKFLLFKLRSSHSRQKSKDCYDFGGPGFMPQF